MLATFIANCADKFNQSISKDAIRQHNKNESVEVRKRRTQLLVRGHHTAWTPEHAQLYRDKANIHDLEVQRKPVDEGEVLGCFEMGELNGTV